MSGWTLARLAEAVGGRLDRVADPAARLTGPPAVDSRAVEPGGVFVAVRGERVDGHDFAAAAVAAGAVAVLAARPVGVPAVLVADPVAALGRWAAAHRGELPGLTVVGVTGSSGKTTTKDLLAAVLERLGPTVAPPGSWNTEIGLPLAVLRAGPATRYLVLEYGARGVGHIARLAALVPPRVGVVLNVGRAHVGGFGDVAAIARAKGELVEALPPDGLAVLNADDPRVRAMAVRTAAPVVLVGLDPAADLVAREVRVGPDGRAGFELGGQPVRLRLHGRHQVGNALAVAAVAIWLGLDPGRVAEALSAAEPRSRWRMEVRRTPAGLTVVNDAYNANPESTAAALLTLASIRTTGRRWAVLGEMCELGAASAAAHREVGEQAARLGVDRVVAVGPAAAGAAAAAGERGVEVPDGAAALALLGGELRAGDVVLVKGSRAAGLEQVAVALVDGGRG